MSSCVRSSRLLRLSVLKAIFKSFPSGQSHLHSRCQSLRRRPCPNLWDWIPSPLRSHPTPSALSQVSFSSFHWVLRFPCKWFLPNMLNVLFSPGKKTTCFFIYSLQLSKGPWCGLKAPLSAICYAVSSGCHCLGLYEIRPDEISLDSCQFPCHFVLKWTCLLPIRL